MQAARQPEFGPSAPSPLSNHIGQTLGPREALVQVVTDYADKPDAVNLLLVQTSIDELGDAVSSSLSDTINRAPNQQEAVEMLVELLHHEYVSLYVLVPAAKGDVGMADLADLERVVARAVPETLQQDIEGIVHALVRHFGGDIRAASNTAAELYKTFALNELLASLGEPAHPAPRQFKRFIPISSLMSGQ